MDLRSGSGEDKEGEIKDGLIFDLNDQAGVCSIAGLEDCTWIWIGSQKFDFGHVNLEALISSL